MYMYVYIYIYINIYYTYIHTHIFPYALIKLDFQFLLNLMEYDCRNCFPCDFEPNRTPSGSKLKEKQLSPQSRSIQYEGKCKSNYLRVDVEPLR